MSSYLYRLGAYAFDHRRAVLSAWLLVLAGVVACAAAFSGTTTNTFSVPGTESQQAQDLLEQKFPAASGSTTRIVYAAPEGETVADAEYRDAIMASVASIGQAADVTQVVDPYTAGAVSADGRIAYADVVYPTAVEEVSDEAKDELEAAVAPATDAGLTVEFGGRLMAEDAAHGSEGVGMMIGYVVLAVTLLSLLAAGMPLLTAVIGVAVGVTGLTALSGVFEVSTVAPTLATMLGLAVGIDYALFILSRHRQNLQEGLTPREAAAQATATAGSAVVFAGLTVVIALVGLTVIGIPFLTVMGLAAAGTVSIAVVIAVTLLPALIGFAGPRLARRNRVFAYRANRRPIGAETAALRWARFVTRRPLAVLLVGLTALIAIALPAAHMKLGLPDGGSQPTSTSERQAYDLLTEGFGPGFNGPLTLVIDAPSLTPEQQGQLAEGATAELQDAPGVAAVSPPITNEAGDLTILSVTPTTGPASDETKDLVGNLRDRADEIPADVGVDAYVTGTTALNIDTADRLASALPLYVGVVVGLALLLLMLVFRSILVPLKAALGFLLSIATSMGLVVWIFQDGNFASLFDVAQTGPIVCFLPVLLIGILFGLAMDYEVFLVSRMRERYVQTGDPRDAIITGFAHSGRVVTAAALIMIAVFGAFVLSPDPVVKSIGLSLAFGVLIDAFVVRMTLVPAVMALLGRTAWWLPRGVDRRLPDVDIEGEKLLANLRPVPAGA